MKPIAAFIFLTVLALVAGPITCVAGVGGHCPAEPHEHAADDHEATPHAPCLGDPAPPAKKAPVADRFAPCSLVIANLDTDATPSPASRAEAARTGDIEPPAFRNFLPLLN